MVKKLCKYWELAVFIFLAGAAGAQDYSGWRLYHAEGDIVLTSRGTRTIYKSGSSEFEGTLLRVQDMIQTGSGRAEIQLIPEDPLSVRGTYTVLKLEENTSLLVDALNGAEPSLELLYGKIRLVEGTASPTVRIRAGNSACILRDSDAALEYVAQPGITQPKLELHCFKGQGGELIPLSQPGAADIANLPVRAGETLTLEYHIPFSYVERKPLEQSVVAYWAAGPFTASPPLAVPSTDLDQVPSRRQSEPETAYVPPQGVKQAYKIKNGAIIPGLICIGAGMTLQGVSVFGSQDSKFRDTFLYGGYGSVGLGVIFLLGAILYNPR
ncbi:MAG: hypothetical protein LBE02_03300 [Spirochaetaceae bacterium]|jgi:hypothetical protein|nr:hypothetical protein [Spirochaetaceae bacterium]